MSPGLFRSLDYVVAASRRAGGVAAAPGYAELAAAFGKRMSDTVLEGLQRGAGPRQCVAQTRCSIAEAVSDRESGL